MSTSLTTERFLSFDIIRGLAVFAIVIIHRVHYTWTGMMDRESLHRAMEAGGLQLTIIVLTIILFMMGGIFYVVSGSVNVYASCRAVIGKRQAPGFVLRRNVMTGLFLLFMNIVHRVLFGNGFAFTTGGGEPEYVAGLITGWLKYGQPVPFSWSLVTEPGTLSIIGIILLVNTGVMAAVNRRRGLEDSRFLARSFLFVGIGILLIYPFLKLGLTPLYEQAYAEGKYLAAWMLGNLCLEYSISPHLAFGAFGAFIGTLLVSGSDREDISSRLCQVILALIGAGGIVLIAIGYNTSFADRWLRAGISIFGLGVFLFIMLLALRLWDWRTRDASRSLRPSWFIERIRLFGRFSLSVFVFEGLLAELMALLFGLAVVPDWTGNLGAVLVFTVMLTVAWVLILSWWSRIQFDGPLEWARRGLKYRVARSIGRFHETET